MFYKLELSKISARKFNYLYFFLTTLVTVGLMYKIDSISSFLDLPQASVVFDIVLKIIFILIMFIMGINFIYSYIEDYNSGVITIIENRNKFNKKNISAVVVSTIYFFVYFVFQIAIVLSMLYFRSKDIFQAIVQILKVDNHLLAYLTMMILLLLFSNLIFLVILKIFNNTNLAIALSMLYFIGSGSLSEILVKKYPAKYIDGSLLNVYNVSFNSWNHYLTFNTLSMWLALLINIIVLVCIIMLVRILKR